MTAGLSVHQRLALAKLLLESIGKRRTDVMIPASRDEMPPGTRLAAKFDGRIAAWVSMPKPRQPSAFIENPGRLLAWVKANYPDKIRPTVEIVVTDELITHLREHFPSALGDGGEVDPQWAADLCAALKDPGYYITSGGEKLTGVPGITLPEAGDPTPTVTLADDAAEIIGAAWRAGGIPADELLALPSGGDSDA